MRGRRHQKATACADQRRRTKRDLLVNLAESTSVPALSSRVTPDEACPTFARESQSYARKMGGLLKSEVTTGVLLFSAPHAMLPVLWTALHGGEYRYCPPLSASCLTTTVWEVCCLPCNFCTRLQKDLYSSTEGVANRFHGLLRQAISQTRGVSNTPRYISLSRGGRNRWQCLNGLGIIRKTSW